MSLEIVLSSLLTLALMGMAFACRRSFAAAHLVSLGLFCVALPLLRAIFSATPRHASDETLFYAYGAVALYAGCVFLITLVLGGRSLGRLSDWLGNARPSGRSVRFALFIFMVLWATRVYKGAAYGIIFSGSGTENAVLALPYWLSTLDSIMSLLGGGALIMLAVAAARGSGRWLWGLIVFELIWVFVNGGRRDVVFLSVVIIWIAWQAQVVRLPTAIAVLAMAASLLYVVTPLFLVVRNHNSNYLLQGAAPFDALKHAISAGYNQCGVGFRCSELTSENIEIRGNAMEFTKSVVNSSRNGYPFLDGSGIMHSLSWSVPSAILPKPEMMTEQFVQASFGLPLVDDAISVPVLAYADLGLLGCMLAGICVALFVRLFSQLSLKQPTDLLALSMLYGLVRAIWNIESDPLAYTVLLRDSALLILVAQALSFVRRRVK